MRPVGIDLFAGAGGLSLGFESAGFDIAAAVEIDPIHCATHEFNFQNCKTICRSVVDITGSDIRNLAGIGDTDVAVVFGGAPCQGFTMIGKRVLDDPRNELVHHFVRLVLELEPAYFAFENVKGLTIGKQTQVLAEMVESFETSNYNVVSPFQILNAAEFGVPQDRHRLFLLGARKDQKLPLYPTPLRRRVTVEDAIKDLPDVEQYPELMWQDWAVANFGAPSMYARRLRGIGHSEDDLAYRRRHDRKLLTSSLRTAHTAQSQRRFAATACEIGRAHV